MDRWDSNKLQGASGGPPEEDAWTPRGRATRAADWRAGEGGAGTPGAAPPLGTRHSLDRAASGWGGRKAVEAARRVPAAAPKDTGRWAKDE